MLPRPSLQHRLDRALARAPAVALLGPRQVGKTTLARMVARSHARERPVHWLDLEDPTVEAQARDPMGLLSTLSGLVVIDEVQRAPELFKVLRVLIDRAELQEPAAHTRFLLLGSASPLLLRQTSESLAGRVELIEVAGLSLEEAGVERLHPLWWRGGFPRSLLAASNEDSRQWRRDFMRTLIERDLPQLGLAGSSSTALARFWSMLAHLHGQVWNAADPARSLGVNEATVRRIVDGLSAAYLVRQLQPWFANIGKRQVKAPKVYLRDSGVLHELLGITDPTALLLHPRCGASWEGFVIEQVMRIAQPDEAWFWATHAGAELDLLIVKDGRRVGIEVKRSDAPQVTRSMTTALDELKLDALYVVYPGSRRYPIGHGIEAVPLRALMSPVAASMPAEPG